MKYLITESQLDRAVFVYLDNQDFIQIEKRGGIYFVNSEGDEYAQIKYSILGGCTISPELIKEISSFFSLDESDSESAIGRWVGNTLQMKVTNTTKATLMSQSWLKIPSNKDILIHSLLGIPLN
jgi:hypothetical protein